jgi:hypothetical protein
MGISDSMSQITTYLISLEVYIYSVIMPATKETIYFDDLAMCQAIYHAVTTLPAADIQTECVNYPFCDDDMNWLKSSCPSACSKPGSWLNCDDNLTMHHHCDESSSDSPGLQNLS